MREPPSYLETVDGTHPAGLASNSKPLFDPKRIASSSSSGANRPHVTNFLHISKRDGSIQGKWTVDPTLSVPEALLVPLPEGETTRENLKIATNDGAVRADVRLISGKGPLSPAKATLDLSSRDGTVEVKVVCSLSESPRAVCLIQTWVAPRR